MPLSIGLTDSGTGASRFPFPRVHHARRLVEGVPMIASVGQGAGAVGAAITAPGHAPAISPETGDDGVGLGPNLT